MGACSASWVPVKRGPSPSCGSSYRTSGSSGGWSRRAGEHLHTVFGIIGDSFRQLCRPNNPRRGPDGYYIPAVHGPLYLQFPRGSASLCRVGEDKPLASLPDLPFPELRLTSWPGDTQKSTMDRRVCLIPNAGLSVMLPGGQESVVLCRFDLDQILSRSGDDYLAVISCPPQMALPGKTFEYQLDVRSKAGKVECRLESGPKGMRVSPRGWSAGTCRIRPTSEWSARSYGV